MRAHRGFTLLLAIVAACCSAQDINEVHVRPPATKPTVGAGNDLKTTLVKLEPPKGVPSLVAVLKKTGYYAPEN